MQTRHRIRPAYGYCAWILDQLYRGTNCPMQAGDEVALRGLTVEVLEVSQAGMPLEARFRFAAPLEDDSLRWLIWRDGDYVDFTPPPIGEHVILHPGRLL